MLLTSYEPAAADLEDVGLAADVALLTDDAAAELAAETADASEELKEDMEADAADVDDDRAAVSVEVVVVADWLTLTTVDT